MILIDTPPRQHYNQVEKGVPWITPGGRISIRREVSRDMLCYRISDESCNEQLNNNPSREDQKCSNAG